MDSLNDTISMLINTSQQKEMEELEENMAQIEIEKKPRKKSQREMFFLPKKKMVKKK
tara:strand:+ start:144 stop:314 length:171 start_codon:yes stop_codon:yes gene_type:complete